MRALRRADAYALVRLTWVRAMLTVSFSATGGLVQDVLGIPSGCGEYQQPEQAQEFVAGERGHPDLVGAALPGLGVLACGGDGQEGVGDQRSGAPAGPGGDLALVQAGGVLAGLEVFFRSSTCGTPLPPVAPG